MVKSTAENLSPTRVKLTVEVPFEEVKPALDKAFKDIANQVQIPGFRKGKVPSRLVEQRFGRPAIMQEAVNDALPDFYQQAAAEAAGSAPISDALREHDLVVVVGAPVFTFHVEGHAAIFDGATTIFQITDDPDAAAMTPTGHSIVATMKPALSALLELLPETKRAAPAGRILPPAPAAGDPIPAEYALHALSAAMGPHDALVEEVPSHRPLMQKAMPMRGQDSFYTMASGGLGYSLPAAVGMALGRSTGRTVCLIGDGSAMYSIQALWTAAQRKLPLTVGAEASGVVEAIGPGVGGMKAWVTAKAPAAGSAYLSSEPPKRRATLKMIGSMTIKPASKKIGKPNSSEATPSATPATYIQ